MLSQFSHKGSQPASPTPSPLANQTFLSRTMGCILLEGKPPARAGVKDLPRVPLRHAIAGSQKTGWAEDAPFLGALPWGSVCRSGLSRGCEPTRLLSAALHPSLFPHHIFTPSPKSDQGGFVFLSIDYQVENELLFSHINKRDKQSLFGGCANFWFRIHHLAKAGAQWRVRERRGKCKLAPFE